MKTAVKRDFFKNLNDEGSFERIGDFFIGPNSKTPFSLFCQEAGTFGKPAVSGKGNARDLVWRDSDKKLEICVHLEYDEETKILSRRDTLTNLSKSKLTIRRWLARFPFATADYELFTQTGFWTHENQGKWAPLVSGNVTLSHRHGRWCEGSVPFAAVRDHYSTHALAFLVFPEGDWTMKFMLYTENGRTQDLCVEAGLSDDNLALELAAEESWQAPEVVVQILPGRSAYSGAAAMNRYLNRRFPARPDHFPIVYNTWLDRMDTLDVPRMEKQLEAAKKAGCEIFVVDYGWYEDYHAFCRVDDWDECKDRSFFGKMKNFADKVRKAGLGFGFWVELEFFSTRSKIVAKHPDWFMPSSHENIVYPKTWLPEVEEYLVQSLAKTIRRYNAVYVKNDMNHSQGWEPSHLSRYQKGLYLIMARLKAMLPQVTFENCSSGSLRMAAGGMMEAFDNHFISDNASPVENLRMFQNMIPRFAPGRVYHWFVASELHPAKTPAPSFAEKGVIAFPQAATWFRFITENLDFALLANFTGVTGISCDLASFRPESLAKVAKYIAFYKKYRASFLRTEGYLLTEPEEFEHRRGWVAYQLSDPVKDIHFVYIFRSLNDGPAKRAFHLQGLDPKKNYKVTQAFPEESAYIPSVSGAELAEDGVAADLGSGQQDAYRGMMLLVQPK